MRIIAGIIGGAAILTGIVALECFTIVQPSTIGIERTAGHLHPQPLLEGPNMTWPWSSVDIVDIGQKVVKVNMHNVQDADGVSLDVDVWFQYRKNPELQVEMYRIFRGKDDDTVLNTATVTAVHEAIGKFHTPEATVTRRGDVIKAITADFKKDVVATLVSNGIPEKVAESVYIIPDVQLHSVTPPDRILNANAERGAAQIDLERQSTMTAIAEQTAIRQGKQGDGIKKLFAALPAGYTAKDVLMILSAITLKENADSFERAVLTNKVNVLPLPQQSPLSLGSDILH